MAGQGENQHPLARSLSSLRPFLANAFPLNIARYLLVVRVRRCHIP